MRAAWPDPVGWTEEELQSFLGFCHSPCRAEGGNGHPRAPGEHVSLQGAAAAPALGLLLEEKKAPAPDVAVFSVFFGFSRGSCDHAAYVQGDCMDKLCSWLLAASSASQLDLARSCYSNHCVCRTRDVQ